MDIHGGIPAQFLICDAGTFREINAAHGNISRSNALGLQKARESLNLKLDPVPECLAQSLGGSGHTPVLGSPELNLLKLESPELERLIMSQQGEAGIHTISQRGSSSQSLMSQLEINSNRNFKAISPIISNDDFQFITETNQALESILPKHGRNMVEENGTHSFAFGMEHFFEPMQQVPGNLETERHMLLQTEAEPHLLDITHKASRHSAKSRHERCSKTSTSSIAMPLNKTESRDPGYEPLGKAERMFENNTSIVYDLNQPSMVSNPYTQSNLDKEKSPGLTMLSMPPIDLEVQEIVKRERKKLKNRVAASKCRKKKLEREAQLEVRVQQLKEKNIELNALASALRQQAGELKQRIMEHVNSGCPGRLIRY